MDVMLKFDVEALVNVEGADGQPEMAAASLAEAIEQAIRTRFSPVGNDTHRPVRTVPVGQDITRPFPGVLLVRLDGINVVPQ